MRWDFEDLVKDGLSLDAVRDIKEGAWRFLKKCQNNDNQYQLTPLSDVSPFSLCFSVFLMQLLGGLGEAKQQHQRLAENIAAGIYQYKIERAKVATLRFDKPFMQLLTFSLSVFYLLGQQKQFPLIDLIEDVLPENMEEYLSVIGAVNGAPQSGNLAMCIAVAAIYARDYLGMDVQAKIDDWVAVHMNNLNTFGFWGDDRVKHLQFQNGYHQYEIFEYLDVENRKLDKAAELIRITADKRGQFAPYFGGSGCYDYDAVSIFASSKRNLSHADKNLLFTTANTIIKDRNPDGGFSESQWIRPRSIKHLFSGIRHVVQAMPNSLRKERARYFMSLLSNKHNRIQTHWTKYSRHWAESNLWDTWFRILTLARIDCAFSNNNIDRWGFIDFPGIGYYSLLRRVK